VVLKNKEMGVAMKKTAASKDIFIDPVCWMRVSGERKDFRATHLMRTYYFCSEECRKAFETNPDKYLEIESPRRKSWLKRYPDRLNKTTGDKPLQCFRYKKC